MASPCTAKMWRWSPPPPQLEDFVRKVSSGQVLVPGTLRNPCCEGWNAPTLGFFGRKEGFEWVVNGSDWV